MIFLLAGPADRAQATHIAGADLTYDCLGNNQYEIELVLYRDCEGIQVDQTHDINVSSQNLNQDFDITISQIPNTGQEITNPCSSAPTTCQGGQATGIQKYVYRETITLPQAATDWTFSFRRRARNNAITTLDLTTNSQGATYQPGTTGPYTYVEAKLNNVDGNCNTSPDFSNEPITFFCVNQNSTYNQGVNDPDGDSIVYSLIPPKDNANATVVYNAPFSFNNPLNGSPSLTIDQNTGDLNVTPTSQEVSVLAVKVEEYRNGKLIGSVIRDIQVYVNSCQNNLPSASGIDSTSSYSTSVCAGDQVSFDIYSADDDNSQDVTMTWNQGIPGGSFSTTGGSRPVGTFTWTPSASDISNNPHSFTVTVQDDACPTNGVQTFSYTIDVEGFTDVDLGPDVNKCAANDTLTASVNGTGGPYSFHWSNGATGQSIVVNSSGTYVVTATTPNGCVGSDTVQVQLSQTGSQNLISWEDTTICGGSSVTIDAGSGFSTYQWSNGDQGQTTTVNSSGTYTVTVTDNIGCQNFDTVTVNLFPSPNVDLGPDQSICQGNSTTLDAGSGFASYQWSTGATSQTITVSSSGNYSVTVVDNNGCKGDDDVNVTVNSKPSVNLGPDQDVCLGDTVSLSVAGTFQSIQWSNGETGNTTEVTASGDYAVTVTNGDGCTNADTVNVEFQKTPFVQLGPDIVVCKSSHTLSVPLGPKGTSYQWSNGSTLPFITVNSSGNYSVTVTNPNGCSSSDDINITFSQSNNQPLFSSNHVNICQGESTTLDPGDGFLSYVWSTGDTVQSIQVSTGGVYSVQVQDTLGCSREDSIEVVVQNPPQVNLGPDKDICQGASATLSVDNSYHSYTWSTGDTTQSIQVSSAGNYSVTATNQYGCTNDDTIQVTVNQPPTVDLGPDQSICNAESATLDASIPDSAAMYDWSTGATSSTITVSSGGTYAVTVTDGNGCQNSDTVNVTVNPSPAVNLGPDREICQGDTATLTASGSNVAYQWNTGDTTQSIDVATSGIYNVTVTDANGCENSGSVKVTVNALPQVSVNGPDTICQGDTATLQATNGYESYDWSTGASGSSIQVSQAGNYSVTVTDDNGCTNSASASVAVSTPPQVTIAGDDTLCVGSTLMLSTDNQYASYSWSTGASGPNAVVDTGGTYSVTVTTATGCTATSSRQIVEAPCCLPPNFGQAFTKIDASNNQITSNTVWEGKYYVSENVYVSNGAILDLTNVDVVFQENTGIIFKDSARAQANNSVFRPCDIDKTWAGFDFTAKSSGHIDESLFKSAEVAVDLTTNDAVSVTNTEFTNFAVGVQLDNAGGNDYDEGITGNTFVSSDNRPGFVDSAGNTVNSFFAVKAYNTSMSGVISQNDFVNQSLSSSPANEYHGVYINSSSVSVSKNTFTNMYRAIDLTGASASVSIQNNEIEYSEQSYQDIYPVRISDRKASPVLFEGNELDYSKLANTSNQQAGIYIENVQNLILASNKIKGFDIGVRVLDSRYIQIDKNQVSEARRFGIHADATRDLAITANSISNMENVGVFARNCRQNVDIKGNAIDVNNYTNTKGIRWVIDSGVYFAPTAKIHNNCIRNSSTAMLYQSLGSFNNRTIPDIRNNYMYNYKQHGLWNVNFIGQIGSCNNAPNEVGKNSFISNYLPPYGNAVDARSDSSTLYLAGNSDNLTITFPNVVVITGCNTTSTASCGNQIGNNEFEGKTSTGYLAQYMSFREFVEAEYPVTLVGQNYELEQDYMSELRNMDEEAQKGYVLSLMNILGENDNYSQLDALYSNIQSGNILSANAQNWIDYRYHSMKGDDSDAMAVLDQIQPSDATESSHIRVATIQARLKVEDRDVSELTESEIATLKAIDNKRGRFAAEARDMVQASQGEHDYIFADIEDTPINDGGTETEAIELDDNFIEVYPNPVDNQLQVSFNTVENPEDVTLQVTNVLGQTLDQRELKYSNGRTELDVSDYTHGTYIIGLYKDGEVLKHAKFMKSK